MTLTLDLSPEVESNLQVAAAQRGQDPIAFVMDLLVKAIPAINGTSTPSPRASLEEFESAMDELSAGSEDHPQLSAEDLTRASFYADHD